MSTKGQAKPVFSDVLTSQGLYEGGTWLATVLQLITKLSKLTLPFTA